jgi:predicted DNA-binding transcriptional regulator AlpA
MNTIISVDGLLKRVPICKASLYNLWKCGKGPKSIFIGGRRFITEKSLNEWIESLEQNSDN